MSHRRRLTRKEREKQRKIIIVSMIGLFCIMSAGYAAFQTNLNINAKGNIVSKGITPSELKNNVVTSGDGLYKDTYEEEKYIYRGADPNNYITFNDEIWRIMSVESDGTLKIIKNESIGNMAWDEQGTRDSSTSTYCSNASTHGCNAWAATNNLVGSPSVFTLHNPNGNPSKDTIIYSGTVTKGASLNTYLNTTYLGTIKEDSKYIVNHNFNVGTPGFIDDTEEIAVDILQEVLYKWNGKVGLMTVTEALRATTDMGCTSLKVANNNNNKSFCSNNNWMWSKLGWIWTISPSVVSYCGGVWSLKSDGYASSNAAFSDNFGVLPAIYLKSDIYLKGSGTVDNPYTIN